MADPVVHFEIASKDGKASQEFYSKLFGWKINADNPMNYGVVETGSDQGIGGGIFQTDENMKPHVTVHVEVDDPDAYLKKIEKMGGTTIVPVTVVPGMVTFALFVDPLGQTVGLVKAGQH